MDGSDGETDGWATNPQDTREQICEHGGTAPFSVTHSLRVARAPDPTRTTVARTYEVAVEWTSALDLPAFLDAIAATCTPYGGDRFGTGRASTAPVDDERFRAAPTDATVRPPAESGTSPALSDPYHYWNTPLARLQADDHYPPGISRITVDLVDGPDAVWTGESVAGVPVERLPEDRTAYARVGLEFAARERLARPTDRDAPEDPTESEGRPAGDGAGGGNRDDRSGDGGWAPAGEPTALDTGLLSPAVDATILEALEGRPRGERAGTPEGEVGDRSRDGDGRSIAAAVEAVERQATAVWSAFRWEDGDPYRIPDGAVEAATTAPE